MVWDFEPSKLKTAMSNRMKYGRSFSIGSRMLPKTMQSCSWYKVADVAFVPSQKVISMADNSATSLCHVLLVGAVPTCAQFHYLVENHEMTRDAKPVIAASPAIDCRSVRYPKHCEQALNRYALCWLHLYSIPMERQTSIVKGIYSKSRQEGSDRWRNIIESVSRHSSY